MKRITNSGDYVNVLPYASEVFGVYQPLLGWRSKQIKGNRCLRVTLRVG